MKMEEGMVGVLSKKERKKCFWNDNRICIKQNK